MLPPPPPRLPSATVGAADVQQAYYAGNGLVCVTIPARLLEPTLAAMLMRDNIHSASRENGKLFYYTRPDAKRLPYDNTY